jgi:hypothetical protein
VAPARLIRAKKEKKMVDSLKRHSTSPAAAAGAKSVEYSPSVRRPSPIIVDINPTHSVALFRKMRILGKTNKHGQIGLLLSYLPCPPVPIGGTKMRCNDRPVIALATPARQHTSGITTEGIFMLVQRMSDGAG